MWPRMNMDKRGFGTVVSAATVLRSTGSIRVIRVHPRLMF
jgi:hypothetical protein